MTLEVRRAIQTPCWQSRKHIFSNLLVPYKAIKSLLGKNGENEVLWNIWDIITILRRRWRGNCFGIPPPHLSRSCFISATFHRIFKIYIYTVMASLHIYTKRNILKIVIVEFWLDRDVRSAGYTRRSSVWILLLTEAAAVVSFKWLVLIICVLFRFFLLERQVENVVCVHCKENYRTGPRASVFSFPGDRQIVEGHEMGQFYPNTQ